MGNFYKKMQIAIMTGKIGINQKQIGNKNKFVNKFQNNKKKWKNKNKTLKKKKIKKIEEENFQKI